MGRFVAMVLAVVMAGGGVAQAGGKHQQWKAVKGLGAGVPVEVQSAGQAGVEDCRVVHVDDTALTCERETDPNAGWGAGSQVRLVFPRSAVEAVWLWEPVPESHAGLWAASVFGFVLGGAVCALDGPAAVVGCGVLGALLAVAFVEAAVTAPRPYPGVWMPYPPPPRPHSYPRQREWRRKLWYRVPAAVAAPSR